MNAVAKLQSGCTRGRDRDVQPYRVLRDRLPSRFAPIRWPHNDRRTPHRHVPRRRSWGCDGVTEPLRIGVVGATE